MGCPVNELFKHASSFVVSITPDAAGCIDIAVDAIRFRSGIGAPIEPEEAAHIDAGCGAVVGEISPSVDNDLFLKSGDRAVFF